MKRLLSCRRTFIAFISIGCLTYLGIHGADVAGPIALIVAGVAGSNAAQGALEKKYSNGYQEDI
jgi:hypothetical protein